MSPLKVVGDVAGPVMVIVAQAAFTLGAAGLLKVCGDAEAQRWADLSRARQTAEKLVDTDGVQGISPVELMEMYRRAGIQVDSYEPDMKLPVFREEDYDRVTASYE